MPCDLVAKAALQPCPYSLDQNRFAPFPWGSITPDNHGGIAPENAHNPRLWRLSYTWSIRRQNMPRSKDHAKFGGLPPILCINTLLLQVSHVILGMKSIRAFFSHTQMESAHQLSALGFQLRIGHRTPGNGNLSLSCRDVQDGTPIFHRHLLTSRQTFYFTYASTSLLVSLTSNAPSNLCKSVKLRRLGK